MKRMRHKSWRRSFIADQRGAVALEMPFVYAFMITILFFPLADAAVAGFKYISAWQALRAFGQSIQYSPPADVTNSSSWASTAIAKADSTYPISNFQLMCGTAVCSSGNTASPMYYSYQTTYTLTPILACPGSSCTYTLSYSERFQ